MTMMQLSKSQGITVFVVGHINKDGNIAGPKVLEHMVDCVLYFEGRPQHVLPSPAGGKEPFRLHQ